MITQDDIDENTGCVKCEALRGVIASLTSSLTSGVVKVQWGDRSKTFGSLADLSKVLNAYKAQFLANCTSRVSRVGMGGFVTTRTIPYCAGGIEGDELTFSHQITAPGGGSTATSTEAELDEVTDGDLVADFDNALNNP